jgi:hypothetical protein
MRSGEIPRKEWPDYFDALGTWAGEEAVRVIGELLGGLSLGRGWEATAGAPLQHGFRALHLIGGPEADQRQHGGADVRGQVGPGCDDAG